MATGSNRAVWYLLMVGGEETLKVLITKKKPFLIPKGTREMRTSFEMNAILNV